MSRTASNRAAPRDPFAVLGRPLPPDFYRRSSLQVAPDLLGLLLCHDTVDGLVAGRIVEVEAYKGPADLAAHSARGRRTARNEVMYAAGGCAYVYFIYGMHFCMNVVTAVPGAPEAVLLRALEPVAGEDLMRERRGARAATAALARGPGNLTRALAIDRRQNGIDLATSELRILRPADDSFPRPAPRDIVRSPRIGVDYAGAWAKRRWRFSLRGSASVSVPPRARPAR